MSCALFTMIMATCALVALTGTAEAQLRVVSYNVNYAGDEAPTLDVIALADGDVVLLQETTPRWERALRRRFHDRYPHMAFHHADRSPGGLAVLSRYPIEADAILPPAEHWFPAERLVVATPLGRVQILHVHLRPAIDQGDWVRGYLTTPPIRRREIEAYWKAMSPDLPVLVAGDFNEEPGATALGFLVDHGLVRADSGPAPTWTWQGNWRGNDVRLRMKLDHILSDRRLAIGDARVLEGGGSDHHAVVVTLRRGQ
jgi:endonuclease/exonuclease/phosphatase (EEP) superfamily protein YafD